MSAISIPSGRQHWFADVVADAFRGVRGFQFEAIPGWDTRGSSYANYSSGRVYFRPVGGMNHHTGGGGYEALLNYMAHNSSIAPLCNFATSRPSNGIVRITLVAAGKANHAGRGYLPWTGTNMGNWRTVGMEHQNTGGQAWPAQQDEGIMRLNAALIDAMGVTVERLVDHKTYAPDRKVDRYAVDVNAWREFVAAHGLEEIIMLRKGDTGSFVKRLQIEINIVLTYKAFGVNGMSSRPAKGVGVNLDGDYGPATAAALREAMAHGGHDVTGETCGAEEWAMLTIFHSVYDDQKLKAEILKAVGNPQSVDTSGFATKAQLNSLAQTVSGQGSVLSKVRDAHNTHRHREGTTGLPNVKA